MATGKYKIKRFSGHTYITVPQYINFSLKNKVDVIPVAFDEDGTRWVSVSKLFSLIGRSQSWAMDRLSGKRGGRGYIPGSSLDVVTDVMTRLGNGTVPSNLIRMTDAIEVLRQEGYESNKPLMRWLIDSVFYAKPDIYEAQLEFDFDTPTKLAVEVLRSKIEESPELAGPIAQALSIKMK